MRRLFFFLLWLLAAPAWTQAPRANAIQPELVVRTAAMPGEGTDLAIVMHTSPGWHGYWLNPGDAGLPMEIEWSLPPGWTVGPLRYPVPHRLLVAGIVNYVYEKDYAVLTRLVPPKGASGPATVSASMRWLACTDKVCVPEKGEVSLEVAVGPPGPPDARFDRWLQALPQPLASPARFAVRPSAIDLAIPIPASLALDDPYFFPADDGPIDYAAPQGTRRDGDTLIVSLARRNGAPDHLSGVLAYGDGRGLAIDAVPGPVPSAEGGHADGLWWAVLGALLGGIILNLMPCVFPILGLKALHLAKAGGDQADAKRDALGYAVGAVLGTGALGVVLLLLRASGAAAGWAFQLQDPRSVLLLVLLATTITLNLLRAFELPTLGGKVAPAGSVGTGALAAFVATPCAGPFMGAALGAALLFPAWAAALVFAALGLGLALPFVAIAFVPALRSALPRPGPWMARLQRILAIPMGLSALAALWLLWRQGGNEALIVGLVAAAVLTAILVAIGRAQRRGDGRLWFGAVAGIALAIGGSWLLPTAAAERAGPADPAWSEARVRAAQADGRQAFVYFTADWCLTCKANEAAAIDRDATRKAFAKSNVAVFAGDWTDGDPAITRFLDSRKRAGVPLYLWYSADRAEPEELPQVLTPSMLISRAQRAE